MRAIATTLAVLCLVGTAQAQGRAGLVPIEVPAPHRGAALEGAAFYPAGDGGSPILFGENPVFEGVAVAEGAPVAEGEHPLIVLSYGLFGRYHTLGWLAAGLAERGAVVVFVHHPGSSVGDRDVAAALDHGARSEDLSAAIDWALADADLGPRIDRGRIAAGGFSLGGWTALSLGGATGDLAGYAAHCEAVGSASTHCADIANAGVDLRALDAARWDASFDDPRVGIVAAIDPGLAHGLDDADLAGLPPDVLLIGLGEGRDRLPATDFSPQGNGLAARIPGAETLIVAPAAHFSVLPVCKPAGPEILAEEGEPPVCTDPEGADRAAVHAEIVDAVARRLGLGEAG